MAVRLRFKISIGISSSDNEELDLSNFKTEVFSDTYGEGGCWKTLVPASSTDLQLTLPNFDEINFIAIRTTSLDPTLLPEEITIKFNGTGNDAIPIAPIGPTEDSPKEGWLLLSTSGLDSLYATNSSTTAMNVTVFACADVP